MLGRSHQDKYHDMSEPTRSDRGQSGGGSCVVTVFGFCGCCGAHLSQQEMSWSNTMPAPSLSFNVVSLEMKDQIQSFDSKTQYLKPLRKHLI